MTNPEVQRVAWQLRMMIENGLDGTPVAEATQELARSLGGFRPMNNMTTGAAAIYLLSLILTQSTA